MTLLGVRFSTASSFLSLIVESVLLAGKFQAFSACIVKGSAGYLNIRKGKQQKYDKN
jgi:hypothetical protein